MPEKKKIVIKVLVRDNKDKSKAMKAVSSLPGIEYLAIDMKDKKLTLIGDTDPVDVIRKLKKWHADILTVGPAKEEKKKDEQKPPANKKKEEEKKTDERKKRLEEESEAMRRWIANYRPINPYMPQQHYVHNVEDYPNNGCVIL